MKTPLDATLTDPSGSGRKVAATLSLVGTSLAHFRIDRLLGKGGMGEVYEATDTALDRRVAVKAPVAGAVDLAHAALAHELDDLIRAQCVACRETQRSSRDSITRRDRSAVRG